MVKVRAAKFKDAKTQMIFPGVLLILTLRAWWSHLVLLSFTHRGSLSETFVLQSSQMNKPPSLNVFPVHAMQFQQFGKVLFTTFLCP